MAKKHGPNKENLEITRRIFLDTARKEFSVHGYYNASTASIVESSGMARGSLYYHFGDKKGLFKAVYEELMVEMRDEMLRRVSNENHPKEAFLAMCLTSLDLLMQKEIRRIVIDVHTAITYQERLEILGRTILSLLHEVLSKVINAGYFKGHEVRPLSLLIFGMLSESGRSFELAQDVKKAREEVEKSFLLFMEKACA
jgi:AcrR family transcriptional regulator